MQLLRTTENSRLPEFKMTPPLLFYGPTNRSEVLFRKQAFIKNK